jgi:4-amino-4-deoxy-L-arabinose transferase-like glycosyltransferase
VAVTVEPIQNKPVRTVVRLPLLLTTIAVLGLLLAVALWLRWQYVQDIGLSVDEFTTLWAARQTVNQGAPLMPSGVLYTRGLVATYVTAAFIAVAGESYTVARLPSVLFGLAAVVVIFLIGRREWNVRVGWLAALGLALLPEAVVWSGRARFYAPLLLFVLLTLWVLFQAISPLARSGQRHLNQNRALLLFVLCFSLALFAQEQTILLYPSIVFAMWLWRGWRYLFQPVVLVANGICVAMMGLRFVLEQVGQPGYFSSVQTYKPYFNLFVDAPALWASHRHLFLDPQRLPWTLAGLVAVAVALNMLAQLRRPLSLPRYHQATLFFALHLLAVMLVLVFVVDSSWSGPRYVFMVQSLWLLLGAAGAVWLAERLSPLEARRWLATAVLATLVAWSLWPLALDATREDMQGYHEAFTYVAQRLQPGDVVMSPQPPACAVVLARPCDYFARERGYQTYAIEHDGELVDRWSGAPILSTAEQLEQVVRAASRVWFVADTDRVGSRYRIDFLSTLVDQFHLVFSERGAVVLLTEGWQDRPAQVLSQTLPTPVSLGGFSLTGWSRNEATPGEQLYMTFFWLNSGRLRTEVSTSLQVVDQDGAHITQKDGPPLSGFAKPIDFPNVPVPDVKKLDLPATMAPGRYRIDVIVYQLKPLELLAEPMAVDWFRIGEAPLAPANRIDAAWQNGLSLVGHDGLPATLAPGLIFDLRLVWQTAAPVAEAYTVFVHLIGPDGQIIAQADRPPEGGFYPTWGWDVGEPVEDFYPLELPADLPEGDYRLVAGFYQPEDFQRPLLVDGSDALELARWTIP